MRISEPPAWTTSSAVGTRFPAPTRSIPATRCSLSRTRSSPRRCPSAARYSACRRRISFRRGWSTTLRLDSPARHSLTIRRPRPRSWPSPMLQASTSSPDAVPVESPSEAEIRPREPVSSLEPGPAITRACSITETCLPTPTTCRSAREFIRSARESGFSVCRTTKIPLRASWALPLSPA